MTNYDAGSTASVNNVQDEVQHQQRVLFQTSLRERITPYLPPPVVKAIQELDPQLEPFVGPEGCVNIFGGLLIAWFMYRLLRTTVVGSSTSSLMGIGGNNAIQEDDRDRDILPADKTCRPFDGTVLLCGPPLAGKTSLFYRLINQQQDSDGKNWKTVRSIKSNTGFLETVTREKNDDLAVATVATTTALRILDTPSHWGPQKLLQVVPLQDIERLVVVMDSTKPVAPAADYLYAIIKSKMTEKNIKQNRTSRNSLMIACHKSDHPKAKNVRRIKLQLRSELIRLSEF